jgi:hypothetical protein
MIAANGEGPPGPGMRRPGVNLANARVSISEPTRTTYPGGSQTSSDISRLNGVVLSAGATCSLPERGDMPREGEICR